MIVQPFIITSWLLHGHESGTKMGRLISYNISWLGAGGKGWHTHISNEQLDVNYSSVKLPKFLV